MPRRLLPVVRGESGNVIALVCTLCHEEKSISEFHKAGPKGAAHGYRMPCKACQRVGRAMHAKKYRTRNPEQVKAAMSAWHSRHPEYERDRGRRRYATDEKYRARAKAAARIWAKAHPEYFRAAAKLRRARLAGVECNFTPADAHSLFGEYAGLCVYCSDRATTLDHVVPISKGGAHTKDNLVPACKRCNSAKHNKSLLIFLATRRVA